MNLKHSTYFTIYEYLDIYEVSTTTLNRSRMYSLICAEAFEESVKWISLFHFIDEKHASYKDAKCC